MYNQFKRPSTGNVRELYYIYRKTLYYFNTSKQIESFLCSLLFLETGRRTLKLGILPTLNLSQKSHETLKHPTRCLNVVKDNLEIVNKTAAKLIYKKLIYVKK